MSDARNTFVLELPKAAFDDLASLASGSAELEYLSKAAADLRTAQSLADGIAVLSSREDARDLDLGGVSKALTAFASLRRHLGCSAEELLTQVSNAVDQFADVDWKAQHLEAWREAQPILLTLLNPDGEIAILEKARKLAYSYSNTLIATELITDIRPVFNDQGTEIARLSVSFLLAIEHYDGEKHCRADFALDYEDVERLLSQCQRSKNKAKAILSSFSSAGWVTSIAGMSQGESK